MEPNKRKAILQKVEQYLQEANHEEVDVLDSLVTGIMKKKDGEYETYINAITQMSSLYLENGDYEIVIPIQPVIKNVVNMAHGGITATLIDTAMGSLVSKKLPSDQAVVTSEINIHYIKPGVGDYLRCVATLLNQGKRLCVTEAKVYSDEGKIVASGSGSFVIINKNR
ncbi:PaaI family thioesterase [Bacillus sp. FJAT-45350]|uniref:PaaI family thioesterase n=1 Tax=Bacillus sp. FJAT-45350 TaxID=2011014 RepID=UPI000BB6D689|nr:PaaI family thioesterase [Bacillus sp. FJAT-45350]